jgi:hypothetical protein
MNETNALLSSLEALLHVTITLATRVGDNQIHFSLQRAKELHSSIKALRKASKNRGNRASLTALDAHLDSIHNL